MALNASNLTMGSMIMRFVGIRVSSLCSFGLSLIIKDPREKESEEGQRGEKNTGVDPLSPLSRPYGDGERRRGNEKGRDETTSRSRGGAKAPKLTSPISAEHRVYG